MKITAAGYRGYNEHYKSDHLAIWVDFDMMDVLGIRETILLPKPKPLRVDHTPYGCWYITGGRKGQRNSNIVESDNQLKKPS